ncbi:NAD(P)/FAD-dependent oxidoreductase [Pseudomonas viridiflava]|uniref:NAD(P)/FAD-dependent oxidoreductase n=1 Tax=Pseudomonas viridiflava TaxID=33069 RepID=UPI0018E5EE5A|nr:FAD-dependent oxidoreductase [Pseudomonas viridiflava]MBI6706151.1 FAD-binding oxidoreductase [Pseudomonas viridiflava]MBI6724992.1 FAD-binding oxidoreductase [Pseudomonas viridiflava]MEE4149960.1 FAD-dependent oxidoreductase [Pseudomonas viridiflava]
MSTLIETDALIIGGGIVGASAALALALKGKRVALLERDFCGSHSSGVNYGGVRRQGRPLSQLPLSQRAHQIWGNLRDLIGIDGEYQRSGHLKLARSEQDMDALRAYAQASQGFGLDLQLLDRAELRARFPWAGDVAVGASLCADDGHANPRLVSPAFARAARLAGAQVFEQAQVTQVNHDGQAFIVETANGLKLRAPWLLNCAGAWAGQLAAQFNEPVPMYSGHPAMLVTEPLPMFMDVSTGVEGGGIYARQVARGNCVLGGGQGFALDPARARPGQAAVLDILRNAVELYPPLKGAQAIRTWSGTEGYLPDREPVLGPSLAQPGLLHGFGFAGAGFQIGPAAGEALAEWVCAGHSSISLDAFSIGRFRTEQALSVADSTLIVSPRSAPEPVSNVIPLHRGRSPL